MSGRGICLPPCPLWGLAGELKGCAEDWIFAGHRADQSVFSVCLYHWSGESREDVAESVHDQWQEKEEIRGETLEAPAPEDLLRELENEMPYETPDSVQKGIWMTKYIQS